MLISFILPTYNVASYISEALEPLLLLPQDNIEVIVVNDESPDQSREIAQGFKGKIANLKIIDQYNAGPSAARNKGLSVAQGKYIAFYDPDDKIVIEEYLKLYQLLEATDADIFVCNGKYLSDEGVGKVIKKDEFRKKLGVVSGPEYFFYAQKHKEYVQLGWINIYRRDFLEKNQIQFTEGISYEDKEFTTKCFSRAESVIYTGLFCYLYRQRESSLSNQEDRFYSPKSVVSYMRVIENLIALKRKARNSEEIKVLNHTLAECYLTILKRLPTMKTKKVPEVSNFTWNYINRSRAFNELPFTYKIPILKKRLKAYLS